MIPVLDVAGLPPMMWDDEDLNLCRPRRRNDAAQMLEQIFFHDDGFDHGPKLAAFAQEAIVRIDKQQTSSVGGIAGRGNYVVCPPSTLHRSLANMSSRRIAWIPYYNSSYSHRFTSRV